MTRLALLTEIIAPYRIPVLNALAAHSEIDLHVIFLAENDPLLREWRVYKDEIRFSYEVLSSWRTRVRDINILVNIGVVTALERADPEVVICGGYNYPAAWQAFRWSHTAAVRFLLWMESTARDLRSRNIVLESLKTKFIRGCDGVVVAGKSSYAYAESFSVPQDKLYTAPDAVDVAFFHNKAEAARRNADELRRRLHLPPSYLLYVGRLVAEKGVFDLLEAYASLPADLRSAMALVFVGEGTAKSELCRRASLLATGSVQFSGFVQRNDLPSYYALAEAFVFPTHTDPWGLVVNEAMSCSLPVICSSAAGCCDDLVQDGWNGRVVRPGSVEQLSNAILECVLDSEMNAVRGLRSREIISHYTPEICAAGLAEAALAIGVVCDE